MKTLLACFQAILRFFQGVPDITKAEMRKIHEEASRAEQEAHLLVLRARDEDIRLRMGAEKVAADFAHKEHPTLGVPVGQ